MSLTVKDIDANIDLLLLELKNGNQQAYRKLFDLYWEGMYANARILLGNGIVAKINSNPLIEQNTGYGK